MWQMRFQCPTPRLDRTLLSHIRWAPSGCLRGERCNLNSVPEDKRRLYMNEVTVKHMYQATFKQRSLRKTLRVLPGRAIIELKSIKKFGPKM